MKIGNFNILADGLSRNEFLCEDDFLSSSWENRKLKVIHILMNMLNTCDIVVTQENDHFIYIFEMLANEFNLPIGGIFGFNPSFISTSRFHLIENLYNNQEIDQIKSVIHHSNKELHEEYYKKCNNLFHINKLKTTIDTNTVMSFQQESITYGEVFSSMYKNTKDDLYRSDDGIGIYYRKDKIQLLNASIPNINSDNIHDDKDNIHKIVVYKDLLFLLNTGCFIRCIFETKHSNTNTSITTTATTNSNNNNDNTNNETTLDNKNCDNVKLITIYGGHLKSGEEYEKEVIRCQQLEGILIDSKSHINPIIVMDSNNSILYEEAYNQNDINNNKNNDILFNNNNQNIIHKYNRLSELINDYDYIDAISFQQGVECFKMRHGNGNQKNKHFKLMFDTIDKILIPKYINIMPSEYNQYEYGFKKYSLKDKDFIQNLRSCHLKRLEFEEYCRNNIKTTCSIKAFGDRNPLTTLYPNYHAPSDHPPISCMIDINSIL